MATHYEMLQDEAGRCGRAHARLHLLIRAAQDAVRELQKHDLPPAVATELRQLDFEARSANERLAKDSHGLAIADYLPPPDLLQPSLHPIFAGIFAGLGARA